MGDVSKDYLKKLSLEDKLKLFKIELELLYTHKAHADNNPIMLDELKFKVQQKKLNILIDKKQALIKETEKQALIINQTSGLQKSR